MFHGVGQIKDPLIDGLLGLAFMLRPPPTWPWVRAAREKRLAALKDGAEERYLDERRSLETYGARNLGIWRILGGIVVALSGWMIWLAVTS